MGISNLFLQVGILWFLITLYSRSTNSASSLRETWIVVIGVMIVGLLARLILGGILGPFVGLINIVALYYLIDKVCGLSREATRKICIWYVVSLIILSILGYILSIPVDSNAGYNHNH